MEDFKSKRVHLSPDCRWNNQTMEIELHSNLIMMISSRFCAEIHFEWIMLQYLNEIGFPINNFFQCFLNIKNCWKIFNRVERYMERCSNELNCNKITLFIDKWPAISLFQSILIVNLKWNDPLKSVMWCRLICCAIDAWINCRRV